MKTYVIDDEEISVYLTKYMLIEENFSEDINTFLSAEEALQELQQNLKIAPPRIIFIDLNMPGMNGWEFLDELVPYKSHMLNHCWIYILTSSLDLNDAARAKEYELVQGFIHKTIDKDDIEEIKSKIKEHATW